MRRRVLPAAVAAMLLQACLSDGSPGPGSPDGGGPGGPSELPLDGGADGDVAAAPGDDAEGPDGSTDPAGDADAGDAPSGGFRTPCDDNDDCFSGYCVPSPAGEVCSRTCEEDCPEGWSCRQESGTDPTFVCLPDFPRLCRPCTANEVCRGGNMPEGSRCILLEGEGGFCGGPCAEQSCPPGYACEEVADVDGASSLQCVPESGACPCTEAAVEAQAEALCRRQNEAGTCEGTRTCTDGGLTPCSAPEPAEDLCDGADDDCDGATDEAFEPSTCEASNEAGTCTGETSCGGSEGVVCDAPEPSPEACNGVDDDCDGTTDEADAEGCTTFYTDADDDGAGAEPTACLCEAEEPFTASSPDDCNDEDGSVRPGAPEVCNGVDDDCDGTTDEAGAEGCTTFYTDADDDGAGTEPTACLCEPGGDKTATSGGDCNDDEASVHPGATESCNGVDDDCDGATDEADAEGCTLFYVDGDDDGAGDSAAFQCLCGPSEPYTAPEGGDCDDGNPDVGPQSPEVCGGVDEDCDGVTDEPGAEGCEVFHRDADGDGFGLEGLTKCLCEPEAPYTATEAGDCDDQVGGVNPEAAETCNGADDDCDGAVDEAGAEGCTEFHADRDGDGIGDPDDTACLCEPSSPYTATLGTDCNDDNPNVLPGAKEVCNEVDDDCDGATDEGVTGSCSTFHRDADDDGYGLDDDTKCLCAPEGAYTAIQGGDCDDGESGINPGAGESCNGVDDDCDGATDEAGAEGCQTFYADADEDGFGVALDSRCLCEPEAPYTATEAGDCNDEEASVRPGVDDVCNGVDDDCDGTTDPEDAEGCEDFFRDADGDGWGVEDERKCLCDPEGAFTSQKPGDCDDGADGVNPKQTESCNGVDDDCDGAIDEAGAQGCETFYVDADDDGAGAPGTGKCLCGPEGDRTATEAGDCDDTTEDVAPNAPEVCNGVDDDCDGATDEAGAQGCEDLLKDSDGDGFGLTGVSRCLCEPSEPWTATEGGDCNDDAEEISPGATEVCNDVDDDCDGAVDEAGAEGCLTFYEDADGDGWGVEDDTKCLCDASGLYTATKSGDCNDDEALRHPGRTETCQTAFDDDCDGDANGEGAADCTTFYRDADDDGFGADGSAKCLCEPTGDHTATKAGDCDDDEKPINPSADESCNGVDDDCDGTVDEGCGLPLSGWPTMKYDQRRTGHSMKVQGPGSASLRWKRDLGEGGIRNSAVLPGDGTVVMATGDRAVRLDAESGEIVWDRELPGTVQNRSGATLRRGGTLVVAAGPHLLMLDEAGETLWSRHFEGEVLTSSPLVDGQGRIYVVSDAAVRRVTPGGSVDWSTPIPNSLGSPGHPAIAPNGRVHFAAANHTVYSMDPSDGQAVWTFSFGSADTDGSVAIGETGDVFQSFGARVVGITPSGSKFAERHVGGDIDSNVAVFNTGFECCNPEDRVFVSPNGDSGVVKMDQNLGEIWTFSLSKHHSGNSTPVFDTDGDVYVGSDEGRFVSIDQSGDERWSFDTQAQDVDATAAIGPGYVVFGDASGTLYCVGD